MRETLNDPGALEEARVAFLRYEQDYPGRGRRFRERLNQTLDLIESNPKRWPLSTDGFALCAC